MRCLLLDCRAVVTVRGEPRQHVPHVPAPSPAHDVSPQPLTCQAAKRVSCWGLTPRQPHGVNARLVIEKQHRVLTVTIGVSPSSWVSSIAHCLVSVQPSVCCLPSLTSRSTSVFSLIPSAVTAWTNLSFFFDEDRHSCLSFPNTGFIFISLHSALSTAMSNFLVQTHRCV